MVDPNKPHHWSGWPGAHCLDCGIEDPAEICLADRHGDNCTRKECQHTPCTMSNMLCPQCHPPESTLTVGDQNFKIAADPVDRDVVHPQHYNNHPSGVECMEIVRHMNFNLGNVFKYIWRADEKRYPIKDLKKAAFYLDDEIKRREKQNKEAF